MDQCVIVSAALRNISPSHRGPLVDTRLLSLASNVTRLYSQWSHRVLPVAVLSKGETYETTEPVEQVVSGEKEGYRWMDVVTPHLTPPPHLGRNYLEQLIPAWSPAQQTVSG